MSEWTLYYNPQCSNCRKVRERLESRGVAPAIIEYLKTPPTAAELESILQKLGKGPEAITRMQEPVVERKGLSFDGLSRKDWLAVIAQNPALLQRPIVLRGGRAVVARPPESVDALL